MKLDTLAAKWKPFHIMRKEEEGNVIRNLEMFPGGLEFNIVARVCDSTLLSNDGCILLLV
jgi:hypothetical protein